MATITTTINNNIGGDIQTVGTAAADTLDGGIKKAPAAFYTELFGGLGNDTYYIDAVTAASVDKVVELANAGIDTVVLVDTWAWPDGSVGGYWNGAANSYTMTDNVENLSVLGVPVNTLGNPIPTPGIAGGGSVKVDTQFNNISIYGNSLNNSITTGSGNDVIYGGLGNDTMRGGGGADTYYVDAVLDQVIEGTDPYFLPGGAGDATDKVYSMVTFTLGSGLENLYLDWSSGNTNGTGNTLNNTIYGSAGNNILTGLAGNDTLVGGGGRDSLLGGDGNDYLEGDGVSYSTDYYDHTGNGSPDEVAAIVFGGDTLDGGNGNDILVGADGDKLLGGAGNDVLYGNALNADTSAETSILPSGSPTPNEKITMDGGAGDDQFMNFGVKDSIVGGLGIDTVFIDFGSAPVNYTLTADVERGILVNGGSTPDVLTGNALNNYLQGNAGGDRLDGKAGNDVLDGATGRDTMLGGLGDDSYMVDNIGDVVIETDAVTATTTGFSGDTVFSYIKNYTLGKNVENLVLEEGTYAGGDPATPGLAVNGKGNELNNLIIGNSRANLLEGAAGNDTLDGGNGKDTLIGGSGNDTYYVDNTADVIQELADYTMTPAGGVQTTVVGGVDSIILLNDNSVTPAAAPRYFNGTSYTMTKNVEKLDASAISLAGSATGINFTIIGNESNNTIIGSRLNDTIIGGEGNDTMTGGLGDDTYYISEAGDSIIETIIGAAGGKDTIMYKASMAGIYTMGANIENMVILGGSASKFVGNALNNVITGNGADNVIEGGLGNDSLLGNFGNDTLTDSGGNNFIDGGAGNDTMKGGAGNDTYVVDSGDGIAAGKDTIVDGGGVDTVLSYVNKYTLGAGLENLTLKGGSAITGIGNELNNIITGNIDSNTLDGKAGNDTIDGGAGADSMIGGAGNDTFYVDVVGDSVKENSGEGTDTVKLFGRSITDYTLDKNVENLDASSTDTVKLVSATWAGNVATIVTAESHGLSTGDIVNIAGVTGFDRYNGTFVVINTPDPTTFTYALVNPNPGLAVPDGIVTTATETFVTPVAPPPQTVSLASATWAGGLATITTTAPHGLAVGTIVTIEGVTGNTGYNGSYEITSIISPTKFTYALANPGGAGTTTNAVESAAVPAPTFTLSLTGNELNNIITGNSNDNIIDGGSSTVAGGTGGADTMIGGDGNDTYFVDNVGDKITELSSGLIVQPAGLGAQILKNPGNADSIYLDLTSGGSTFDMTTNALNVERLHILDNVSLTSATWAGGTATITTSAAHGLSTGDIVNIAGVTGNAGYNGLYTITVTSTTTFTYTLANDPGGAGTTINAVEFSVAGSNIAGSNVTGNASDNIIWGGGNKNNISGGDGNDIITGGASDDTLTGGNGNDVLNGDGLYQDSYEGAWIDAVAGKDSMNGGEGSDTYYVNIGDGAGTVTGGAQEDVVNDTGLTGTDTVKLVGNTITDYKLDNAIENLDASGLNSNSLDVVGNSLNNVITGLATGGYSETLSGGNGNDSFILTPTNGANDTVRGGSDTAFGGATTSDTSKADTIFAKVVDTTAGAVTASIDMKQIEAVTLDVSNMARNASNAFTWNFTNFNDTSNFTGTLANGVAPLFTITGGVTLPPDTGTTRVRNDITLNDVGLKPTYVLSNYEQDSDNKSTILTSSNDWDPPSGTVANDILNVVLDNYGGGRLVAAGIETLNIVSTGNVLDNIIGAYTYGANRVNLSGVTTANNNGTTLIDATGDSSLVLQGLVSATAAGNEQTVSLHDFNAANFEARLSSTAGTNFLTLQLSNVETTLTTDGTALEKLEIDVSGSTSGSVINANGARLANTAAGDGVFLTGGDNDYLTLNQFRGNLSTVAQASFTDGFTGKLEIVGSNTVTLIADGGDITFNSFRNSALADPNSNDSFTFNLDASNTSSLNKDDTINAGGGNDTLTADVDKLDSLNSGQLHITGVETLTFKTLSADGSVDAQFITDAETVDLIAGNNTLLTVQNLDVRNATGANTPGQVNGSGTGDIAVYLNNSLWDHDIDMSGKTGGNDTVVGGDLIDNVTIDGGTGADLVMTNAGDDNITVSSLTNADTIDGGVGFDSLTYAETTASNDLLNVSNIEAIILTNTTANAVETTADVLVAAGSSLSVDASNLTSGTLTWNGSAETDGSFDILGGGGADTITGGDGDDTLSGGGSADSVIGGKGDDEITMSVAAASIDTVYGDDSVGGGSTDYTDTLKLTGATNTGTTIVDLSITGVLDQVTQINNVADATIQTGFENLDASGMSGAFGVDATASAIGSDIIGGSANDTLRGGVGNDTLSGSAGTDTVIGDAGNDVITMSTASIDVLYGDDSLGGGASGYSDTLKLIGLTSTGTTIIDLSQIGVSDQVTQINNVANAAIQTGFENLDASGMTGTRGVVVTASASGSIIIGTGVADTITAGAGVDILTGGGGVDHFQFKAVPVGGNVDTITDFVSGIDVIDLSHVAFSMITTVTGGTLDSSEFVAGSGLTSSSTAGTVLVYNTDTGNLYYDADANGNGEVVLIGHFDGLPALTANDFNIIA